ncbi:hypothetical protein NVV43_28865, partial [Escherichia marmotae]|nr:hypothetical protein [Escherichia marmotae]
DPGTQPKDASGAFTEIVERIGQVPGVLQASMIAGGIPLGGSMSITDLKIPGRKMDGDEGISIRRVTPDYHHALRIRLKDGR